MNAASQRIVPEVICDGVLRTTIPQTDADLLTACQAFDELEARAQATFVGVPCEDAAENAAQAERVRIYAAQEPYEQIVLGTPALTRDGLRAKARSMLLASPDLLRHDLRGEQMLRSLLRDVLGSTTP